MKGTIISEIKFGFTVCKPKPIRIICDRCSGSGSLPQFKHIENGVCFKCRGNGVVQCFSKKN